MVAPTKLTKDVIIKLERMAEIDASVQEMAYYVDVSPQTIYNWLEKDKELMERLERLRAKPVLQIRKVAVKGAKENYSNAIDYLKRKRKQEFGDHTNIQVTAPKPLLDILELEAKEVPIKEIEAPEDDS